MMMKMDDNLSDILIAVANHKITPSEAMSNIKKSMLVNVNDFVQFDLYRENRSGIPEIVYAEKKTPSLCIEIALKVIPIKQVILFTRLTKEHFIAFEKHFKTSSTMKIDLDREGRLAIISSNEFKFTNNKLGKVGIITAGTSDIQVAKETQAVLKLMSVNFMTSYDLGIAGLHRIINPLKKMLENDVDVIVAIAGMEGALPSIISGLVDIPVIGVPTSVQISGIKPGGEVALLSMLTSCSPGMAVVNIDSGFSAGAISGLIAKQIRKIR